MREFSDAQAIEVFHISFLGGLASGVDQEHLVLKGGANLRYFFDSLRYSEDIDLDVTHVKAWQLEEKVDRILNSQALALNLRRTGISVSEFSKPKQTDTTQRWKVGIAVPGRGDELRTKIEFSHRRGDTRFVLEYIPGRVVEPYALRPPSIQHYEASAALEQKVAALAGRSMTQARDVFDLDLLLRIVAFDHGSLEAETIELAKERAVDLPFDAFRDQVLPFLEPEVAATYDTQESWQHMQEFVALKLGVTDEDD